MGVLGRKRRSKACRDTGRWIHGASELETLQSHLLLFLFSVGFHLTKKVTGKITQKYLTFKKASKAQLPDVR